MRLMLRLTIVILSCVFSFEICANGSLCESARRAGRLEILRGLPRPSKAFVDEGSPAHRLIMRVIRRPRVWYPALPPEIAQVAVIKSRDGSIAFYCDGSFGGITPLTYYDGGAAISRSDLAAIEGCAGKGKAPRRAGGSAHGR